MTSPASVDVVATVLKKALASGNLHRIPKHPDHRDTILAIIALALRRRYPYTEPEINDVLKTELTRLRAQVDHVTCRRYLVDLGFVKRDLAGNCYLLNYPMLESALSADVMTAAHDLLADALAASRPAMRNARQGGR